MILMVLKENEKKTLLLTVSCPLCLNEYFWKFICFALEIYFDIEA